MKILLTIHHYLNPNAGAPGITLKLGQEYQKLGHKVSYYGFDNLPESLPRKVKSVTFPEFLAFHISTLSGNQSIDVVDASTGDAWLWELKSRHQRVNRPLLVTRSHGLEHTSQDNRIEEAQRNNRPLSWKYPLYHGGFRLWEVATSLRHADLTILYNHNDLEYAVNKLGIKREKTRVVYNGISEAFLNLPFEPTPEEIGDSAIGIAQVGSYILRKGIHYSIPALNAILTHYPQVKVSFLGTGCSEAEVLKDFDPSVRDRIRVVPRYTQEMLPTLLKGYQIQLIPSLSEGLPLVLMEGMACGLIPIATAIPGLTENVRDGYNVISIPPRDSQAIEQAIERLINNRSYLEQLRRNAHSTAQNYSWAGIARDNLALYEEALSKKFSTEKLLHS